MWGLLLLAGVGLAILGIGGTVVAKRVQGERQRAQLVDDLHAAAGSHADRSFRTDLLTDLPAPVQRYFQHVLRDGQPCVEAVRMEQHGTFRSDAAGTWRPFTATQHVAVCPPGFVWNATIRMGPLVPVRVLDAYHNGRGRLQARIGDVLTVMEGEPGPQLDEGELLRYLAEAPLYPTALLPSMGVSWTPIDDQSARATLTDQGTTASLVFHFNDRNEVAWVDGERGFMQKDGTTERRPWVGYWRRYEERGGMRVPTEGEVAWIHPDVGEASYWRGQMDALEYRMMTARDFKRTVGGGDKSPHGG